MAENFNLIFGSNAPDSTTWSDADYQTGWATVGSTPPTAEQFDFLQNRADLKAKELKDTLDPLVNRAAEEGRQPSTAYALGDTATANGIPTAWFLECTTAGTTDSSDITIPSPLTEGGTITDGTVVWTVRKCFTTNGGALAGTSLAWNGDDLGGSAIVAMSLGGNGYVKRASGEIVQWGVITLAQNSTTATGTLPIAFTSIATARIVGNVNYTDSTSAVRAINISLPTASTIRVVTNAGITTGGVGITWIAIGR